MLALHVRQCYGQGETITINADGSVSPPTAPINTLDNITYVLTGNVDEGITVQRSNIVIDGNGFALTPEPTNNYGFNLTDVDNVTITDATLDGSAVQNIPGFLIVNTNGSQITSNNIAGDPFGYCFSYAFSITSCFDDNMSNNRDSGTTEGMIVQSSGNDVISNNYFTEGIFGGILVHGSNNNILIGNHVSGYATFGGSDLYYPLGSLELAGSNNNTVIGNDITGNGQGIDLFEGADNNTLIANNCSHNQSSDKAIGQEPAWGFGILVQSSSNNLLYHNNVVGNGYYHYPDETFIGQNAVSDGSPNLWDDGYPSGGNFWGDYNGTDLHNGPHQNVSGSDGIGDTPYVVDAHNLDHYPLMGAFSDFGVASGVDVQVLCNSTLSDFQWVGDALYIYVSAENDTATFCRLTVPTALSYGTPLIYVNDTHVQYEQLTGPNGNVTYLYFTYGHSTLPEFPGPLILTVFMATMLLATVIHRKKHNRSTRAVLR